MSFGLDHPQLRPLWVRILLVVLMAGWAVFEHISGNTGWGVAMGILCIYCALQFFVFIDYSKTD